MSTEKPVKKILKKALLVIDVQNEYMKTGNLPIVYPPKDTLPNILKLMDFAKEKGIPIYAFQHTMDEKSPVFGKGSKNWEVVKEVVDKKCEIMQKKLPGCFTGTGLGEKLKGIDSVVITGYMTHMCCDTTARQAVHAGFKMEFISDATGTIDVESSGGKATAEELHRSTLVAQGHMFGVVMDTKTWLEGNK